MNLFRSPLNLHYLCTHLMVKQKKSNMKKIFKMATAVMVALSMMACGEKKFKVEGAIENAKDSLLYFESMGLEGPVCIDSVKLDDKGSFAFSAKETEAPEFYRLRIGDQIINIAIDSTETITIQAKMPNMAAQYKIEGSEDCERIRQLALMQIDLQNKAIALQENQVLDAEVAKDSLLKMIDAYKNKVKNEYIFKDPKAASSYFALFQTLGNYLIFNPRNNRDDIRVFAAVATSWDTYYPGAIRGENLHNIALTGMKNERIVDAEQQEAKIDESKITTAGLIDIQLQDNKGKTRSLSELKGKVVMLDFHVFGTKESPQRILMLRELYNKYHAKGFEIYQVALDPDEHFWKQQTAALPWICVRDENGLNSQRLAVYNISSLPEYFLIDRDNNLVSRSSQISNINKAIEDLL